MANPDTALQALREIIKEFSTFVAEKGSVSESDTRAKLIDRILVQVCGWQEAAIAREEHVDSGFIDYSLTVQNRRYVAVEAKKEGIAFSFPVSSARTLKLSGSLVTDKSIKSAVEQVRACCDDAGIRYAIATNGYAWIVFRAIREDVPWREGHARIFSTLENVEENFTDFWNLLSFDAIRSGSLDEEFGPTRRIIRKLRRVVDRLFNADLPLQRNRLHAQLHPIIQSIFQDIAGQDPVEILRSCYIHAESPRLEVLIGEMFGSNR
jgi:predicted type IV restriction endonuclease